MRSFLLPAAILAAAAMTTLTPSEASAAGRTVLYYPPYYHGAYSYTPGYYTPSPYSTAGAFGGYGYVAPAVSSYYGPMYGAPAGPTYIYTPDASSFTPIYSGPNYFHGYAPNRLWIYP